MANRNAQTVDRDQAQTVFARLLLERVRADKHPSVTHMAMLEQSLPPSLTGAYLNVLLEKVRDEPNPSISLLRRIQRIVQSL
jgi:hypothetical protein